MTKVKIITGSYPSLLESAVNDFISRENPVIEDIKIQAIAYGANRCRELYVLILYREAVS